MNKDIPENYSQIRCGLCRIAAALQAAVFAEPKAPYGSLLRERKKRKKWLKKVWMK